MGEIADLMLDGILCEQCGVYIGEAIGYTRNCQNCQPKRRHNSGYYEESCKNIR